MAGRKPKKVGMMMMYDDGLLLVAVFEKTLYRHRICVE